jgi:histidinol-phosphate aminotransferase
MFENLLRENIKRFVFDFSEKKTAIAKENKTRLDANENPFGSPLEQDYNRFGDGDYADIKAHLCIIKNIATEHIFIGNGIEESIEVLLRAFCEPAEDNIIICPPTVSKYEKIASLNNVKIKKAALDESYQLDIERIAATIDNFTKIIFLCSPNDPTGNALHFQDIEIILNNFDGIVVLDETYINYSRQRSFLPSLCEYPNLIILQNLSHAWGLAGVPMGLAFADAGIIDVMQAIRTAAPIAKPSNDLIIKALENIDLVNQWTKDTVALRTYFLSQLEKITWIEKTYPSDANFILVETKTSVEKIYNYYTENNVLLYVCSDDDSLQNCLRVSVGTLQEIELFLRLGKNII